MKLLLATIAFASISTQVMAFGSSDACNSAQSHYNENFKSSEIICDNTTKQVRIVKPQVAHFGETKNILSAYSFKEKMYNTTFERHRKYDRETFDSLCRQYGLTEIVSFSSYNFFSYLKTGIYFTTYDLSENSEKQQDSHTTVLASITCK